MQITIGQPARVVKTGTNKQGGAWELIAVKSAKGTEYTTFDKKVKHLGAGSVIEIGEPEENNGKLSFSKVVEVITEVTLATVETKELSAYKRDTEGIQFEYQLKASLQQIERTSIEAQVALKCACELVKESNAWKVDGFEALVNKALKWAGSRLDESMKPAPKAEPKPAEKSADKPMVEANGKGVDPAHPFPNIGALLTWCAKQGIDRAKFMEILQVKEKDLPNVNIADAHQVILDYLKQNPKDPAEGLFE